MEYTIQVVWCDQFKQYVLLIQDQLTGRYLSLMEYERWIQIIGGIEKPIF
jgi:hypothetical protein